MMRRNNGKMKLKKKVFVMKTLPATEEQEENT
jgi:hypothetical protein